MTDPVPVNPQPDIDADEFKKIRYVSMTAHQSAEGEPEFSTEFRPPAGWHVVGGLLYTQDETGSRFGTIEFRFTQPPVDSDEDIAVVE